MQILAAARRFSNKYYYQLDRLKLSRDQKQYFNRDRWKIALISKQYSLINMCKKFFPTKKKKELFYEKLKGDILKTVISLQPFFGQNFWKNNEWLWTLW